MCGFNGVRTRNCDGKCGPAAERHMRQIRYFEEHRVVWIQARDHKDLYWIASQVTEAWETHIRSYDFTFGGDDVSDVQFFLTEAGKEAWDTMIRPALEARLQTSVLDT